MCCGSWGCKESYTTERLNWTELLYNAALVSLQCCVSFLQWNESAVCVCVCVYPLPLGPPSPASHLSRSLLSTELSSLSTAGSHLAVCLHIAVYMKVKEKVKSLSRVWLCEPVDCSPAGASVHEYIWSSVQMSILISQFVPPSTSPLCPHLRSLSLHVCFCSANILLFPFNKLGNQGLKKLNDLLQITKLKSDKIGAWTHYFLIPLKSHVVLNTTLL